ncbi:MAG: Ig-like domain-containing protein [Candidatus Thermoplasmatota archaeon]
MKKYIAISLAIFFLLNFNVNGTTYNTISIDGSLADWKDDEKIGIDAGKELYITWDNDNIYIGWNGTDFASEGDLFIYFDTKANGSFETTDWSGRHSLPFLADYAFCIEDSNYWDLREYSGTWSIKEKTDKTYIGWSGNNKTEIGISKLNISAQSYMNVLVFAQWESNNNVFASFPTENPANNNGNEKFTHYFNFSLVSGISPNSAVVKKDDVPPLIYFLYPKNDENITSPSYFIKVYAKDDVAIDNVKIKIDTGDWNNMYYIGVDTWGFDWGFYPPGLHSLIAKAWDKFGNNATTSITCNYIFDNTPPYISIAWPKDGELITWHSYVIKVIANDTNGIKSVEIKIDDKNWEDMYFIYGDEWGYNWSNYNEGMHLIKVRALDNYNNSATTTITCNYTTDLAPPELQIVSPKDGEEISSANYTIVVMATDDKMIDRVEIKIDNNAWVNMVKKTNDTWEYLWKNYDEGLHSIAVIAWDSSGKSTTKSISCKYKKIDISPPNIIELNILEIEEERVVVLWLTDENSTTEFYYSLDGKNYSIINLSLTNYHLVEILGLEPGKTYYFNATSRDLRNNSAIEKGTFKTKDYEKPKLLYIEVKQNKRNATITWYTDFPSTSEVEYDGKKISDLNLTYYHKLDLTNLTPATEYNFKVASENSYGKKNISNFLKFKTLEKSKVKIRDISFFVNGSSVNIIWLTDAPSTSEIEYYSNKEKEKIKNLSYTYLHIIKIDKLKKGLKYKFKVKSTNEDGNYDQSDELSFEIKKSEEKKTPGFEAIGMVFILIAILIWWRK